MRMVRRQRLKDAGIKVAKDVGEWVAELLEKSLQRPQIAKDLCQFVGISASSLAYS